MEVMKDTEILCSLVKLKNRNTKPSGNKLELNTHTGLLFAI